MIDSYLNPCRYDHLATIHQLESTPSFRRCIGPRCESGQLHQGGSAQPIMTCIVCQFKTCYTHQVAWHTNISCEEYDAAQSRKQEENAASILVLEKTTKFCPGVSCGVRITKISGCDHMTCKSQKLHAYNPEILSTCLGRRCAHEFCWVCLSPYSAIRKSGNSAHRRHCPHHSKNLPRLGGTFPAREILFPPVAQPLIRR